MFDSLCMCVSVSLVCKNDDVQNNTEKGNCQWRAGKREKNSPFSMCILYELICKPVYSYHVF